MVTPVKAIRVAVGLYIKMSKAHGMVCGKGNDGWKAQTKYTDQ